MQPKNILLAAVAFAAMGISSLAHANDQGLTREQVVAELLQAKAEGKLLPPGDGSDWPPISFKSTKTRAQVIADLQEARANGQMPPTGDSSDWPPMPNTRSTLTRAEVIAEYVRLREAGCLPQIGESADWQKPCELTQSVHAKASR